MQKLWDNYDGKSEGERRKKERKVPNKLHYCHEHNFPFEKCITELQSNFKVLEGLSVPLYREDKMIYLLNKISVNNIEFELPYRLKGKGSIHLVMILPTYPLRHA